MIRNAWFAFLPISALALLMTGACDPQLPTKPTNPGPIVDPNDPNNPGTNASTQEYGLLSLNLHCLKLDFAGSTFTSNRERMAAIADAMAAEKVHAAALQEVCRTTKEDALGMLVEELARATGQAWAAQRKDTHIAFQGTPDEADEGIAVVAQGAFADTNVVEYFEQGLLTRRMLGATLANVRSLKLYSVQFEDFDSTVRTSQARQSAVAAVTLSDPSLDVAVAGDFNASEGSEAYLAMKAYGFSDFTATLTSNRIDHVFMHRGAAFEVLSRKIIFDGTTYPAVTDHIGGMLIKIRPRTVVALPRTRLTLTKDVGVGSYIAVRGDTAPLTWNYGWPALNVTSNTWTIVLTEIPSATAFEYKCYCNDTLYQQGANLVGTGGQDMSATPIF